MSCYDLDLWPLDLELLWSFGRRVQAMCKFEQNRTIRCWVIDDLHIYFPGGFWVVPSTTPQRGVDRTLPNLQRTELYHRCVQRETLVAIRCFVLKWWLLENKRCRNRGQISHILTPCNKKLCYHKEDSASVVFSWFTSLSALFSATYGLDIHPLFLR